MVIEPAPPIAVLDSEALSVLAERPRRSTALRRMQAVLEVIEERGGSAVVPAPVLVEVSRGSRSAGIARVVNRMQVVSTGRSIATAAGALLHEHDLDSRHAVDALVAATAATVQPSVIVTADPTDMARLTADLAAVEVFSLP